MHTDTGEIEAVMGHDDHSIMVYFPMPDIRPWGADPGLYAVGVGAHERLVVYCPVTRTMRADHHLPPEDIRAVWEAASRYIVRLDSEVMP